MSFGAPWFLALLVVWWLVERHAHKLPRPAIAFPAADVAARVTPSRRRRLSIVSRVAMRVAVVAAITALARPRVAAGEEAEARSGVDLLLVVDVSSSMRMRGTFDRPRYLVVNEVVERFIRDRTDDRIGLLTFARFTRLVCPLTHDHAALAKLLEHVVPVAENSSEDRTAIGVALATAVTRAAAEDGRTKVIVLLTDGNSNVDDIPSKAAAEFAKAHGVRVHTVLAGANRAAARELAAIAQITGGSAHTATDPRALERVYAAIDGLEARDEDVRRSPVFAEVAPWLAALACALLALAAAAEVFWLRRLP